MTLFQRTLPSLEENPPKRIISKGFRTAANMAGKYSFLSLFSTLSLLANISSTFAFPSYGSLGGLSGRELDELVARLPQVVPPNPPGPLEFSGAKLVYDADHPWQPLRPGDIRGPCPGLNTLASHGVSLHFILTTCPRCPQSPHSPGLRLFQWLTFLV